MASSSAKAASIVYHESRTWSLDPTFNNYAKLSIQDVQQLPTYPGYPGVFSILNHPIINVHVMGDVTFVNRKALLIEYEGRADLTNSIKGLTDTNLTLCSFNVIVWNILGMTTQSIRLCNSNSFIN